MRISGFPNNNPRKSSPYNDEISSMELITHRPDGRTRSLLQRLSSPAPVLSKVLPEIEEVDELLVPRRGVTAPVNLLSPDGTLFLIQVSISYRGPYVFVKTILNIRHIEGITEILLMTRHRV